MNRQTEPRREPKQQKDKYTQRVEPDTEQWEVSSKDAFYELRILRFTHSGGAPLTGSKEPGLDRPDSKMRRGGATSPPTLVHPSTRSSVSGLLDIRKMLGRIFLGDHLFGLQVPGQTLAVLQARHPRRKTLRTAHSSPVSGSDDQLSL